MAADTLVLYGCRGCGSAVIEVLLGLAGAAYEYREVEPWTPGPAVEGLRAVNPLLQVPTLRFADGTVMTESAAIIVALDEAYPQARLLPAAGTAARRDALRWIVFIAANMYAAISVGDFPERWVQDEAAHVALKLGSRDRLRAYWSLLEASLTPSPYLAGDTLTALDVYAAMLSRWRPGRAWIDKHCPRLAPALALAEQHPAVASVWQRNFDLK